MEEHDVIIVASFRLPYKEIDRALYSYCCLFGFNVAFNIFQSYHDGVWLRQRAQCSLL